MTSAPVVQLDVNEEATMASRPDSNAVSPRQWDPQGVMSSRFDMPDFEPSFLEANTEVTIDSESSKCVHTDDLEEAADLLQEKGLLVLCGPPGSGKTTLGHALLRRCRKEGFKTYNLSKLEDWHTHVGTDKPSAVLMDGILGEVRVDRQEYKYWRYILRTILELTERGQCKLVLTLYPHVLRELQRLETERRSPLLDSMVVMQLPQNTLDSNVKRTILDFHLKDLHLDPNTQRHLVERILHQDVSGPVFFWCCRHLVDLWQLSDDPISIFTAPAEAYVSLLTPMLQHEMHGKSFAAVLALAMLGLGHFLHQPLQAQAQLIRLGFTAYCDDHLADYADLLYTSFLSESGRGFSSRVLYDAAGLALGRSFRLPILLRACDITFLVQHVHVVAIPNGLPGETANNLSVNIGLVSSCSLAQLVKTTAEDCQSLVERVYEEIICGNLPEISQHTSLQLPEFQQKLEEFCLNKKNAIKRLVSAVDPVHKLPLVYWSVFNQSQNLTQWCLNMMIKSDSRLLSAQVLLACSLFLQWGGSTGNTELKSLLRNFLTPKLATLSANSVVLPLLKKTDCLTDKNQRVQYIISGPECDRRQELYLADPSLPIPPAVISVQVSDKAARVNVRENGDWYLVLRLLTDSQVDETDQDGNTLLHLAADAGHIEAIRLVVESGASMLVKNIKGKTPYQLAQQRQGRRNNRKAEENHDNEFLLAIRGCDEVKMKTLLCHGVSVNYKDSYGSTGLFIACREKYEGIAELLVSLGADVDCQSDTHIPYTQPDTALGWACYKGMTRMVQMLVQQGADVHIKTKEQEKSNLHFACSRKYKTASSLAEISRDISGLLVDCGANVCIQDENGRTPLHFASIHRHRDTAHLLIRHGADVNAQDNKGFTPLYCACIEDRKNIVDLLIHHGADVNVKNKYGNTPLHGACIHGHKETADLLVRHGADVRVQNRHGYTPLHEARLRGDEDSAKLLIYHGADVNDQTDNASVHKESG